MALARAIQAKLEIGSPNDRFEWEAERVADQVVGMPHTPTFVAAPLPGHADRSVQRMCDECSEEDKPLLQRMPLPEAPIRPRISALRNGITARPASPSQATVLQRQDVDADETLQAKTATGTAPDVLPDVETGVHALQGRGQPLSSAERAFFEPRFGHDFGQVRIHTDAHAAASARAVKARAFTLGRDVVFGAGQYTPETATGRQVLAHELTHVVQQGLGKSGGVIQRAPSLNGWIFNTVRVSADNCAAAAGYKRLGPDSQFYSSQSLLYPSLHKAVTNGMESKAIVSDHAPGTSYDIKRVAERNSWQRDSAADPWHPVPGQHKPSGTNDDPNDLDECLSPIPQAHLEQIPIAWNRRL